MSTAIRIVCIIMGALITGAAGVVWLFGLLPADAPGSAEEILAIIGIGGFFMVMSGITGDS